MRRSLLLAFIALAAASSSARGQVVRGVLVDSAGAPVSGGIVVLLDPATAQHGGTFTDAQGRFELRAPSPGRWRVRAERSGYLGTMTPLMDLAAGATRDVRMTLPRMSVRLSEIRVTATRRCVIHPERGAETAQLWASVRTALRATALTSQQHRLGLRIATFERELDPTGAERWATRRERTTYSETPFVSVPIEDLEGHGFVRKIDETVHYRIPDAVVLLSDRFLETHCFRVEPPSAEAGDSLVGLAFEPAPGRTLADVQGVLWVHAESAELRRLDVRFVHLEPDLAEQHAGGRIEFRRLPTGHWIVGRWVIRMPVIREHRVTDATGVHERTVHSLHALHEAGGDVVAVLGERRLARAPARITGTVFDSTRGQPLAGARVYVSGTSLSAISDDSGAFVLEGVPAGDHAVAFLHPRLDSLATVAPAVTVGVAGADTVHVALAAPSWTTLVRTSCGDTLASGTGAIVGWVRSAGNDQPLADAEVTILWSDPRAAPPARRIRIDVVTDRAGMFRACGVPASAGVRTVIGAWDHAPAELRVRVRAGELTRIDRTLPREPGRIHRPPGLS